MLINLSSARDVLDKCKRRAYSRSEVCAVTRLSKRMLSKFGTEQRETVIGFIR